MPTKEPQKKKAKKKEVVAAVVEKVILKKKDNKKPINSDVSHVMPTPSESKKKVSKIKK